MTSANPPKACSITYCRLAIPSAPADPARSRPQHRRQGVGAALLTEANRRSRVRWHELTYTPAGLALLRSLVGNGIIRTPPFDVYNATGDRVGRVTQISTRGPTRSAMAVAMSPT